MQQECIPQAILGTDVLCQAKSGMGKTLVFVLSILQQLQASNHVQAILIGHCRELAFQIASVFVRLCKYLPQVKTCAVYGGVPIAVQCKVLENEEPTIVVGTPGRVAQMVREKMLDVSHVKYFVLDECDAILDSNGWKALFTFTCA